MSTQHICFCGEIRKISVPYGKKKMPCLDLYKPGPYCNVECHEDLFPCGALG